MSKPLRKKKKSHPEGYDIADRTEYSPFAPPPPPKTLLTHLSDDEDIVGTDVCLEDDERYKDQNDIYELQDAEWKNLLREHEDNQDTSSEIDRIEEFSDAGDDGDGYTEFSVAPLFRAPPKEKTKVYTGSVVALEEDYIP
jgi:hypothetical protein